MCCRLPNDEVQISSSWHCFKVDKLIHLGAPCRFRISLQLFFQGLQRMLQSNPYVLVGFERQQVSLNTIDPRRPLWNRIHRVLNHAWRPLVPHVGTALRPLAPTHFTNSFYTCSPFCSSVLRVKNAKSHLFAFSFVAISNPLTVYTGSCQSCHVTVDTLILVHGRHRKSTGIAYYCYLLI